VLKDVVQNVLYTLGQLSNEFPEVTDLLAQKLEEAELKMPPRPPSRATGPAGKAGSLNQKGNTYSGNIDERKYVYVEMTCKCVYLYIYTHVCTYEYVT
jgi:hypothetical protein